jgi:hypothetical protein
MYSAIMQSRSATDGIRQTAVIPNGDEPLIYTRVLGDQTKLRGSAGAWLPVSRLGRADLWMLAEQDQVLGNPAVVFMTANDERDLAMSKPSTLLQKLARVVQGEMTDSPLTFEEVFGELCRTADHKPQHLARYAKSNMFDNPAVAITREDATPTMPEAITPEVCVGTTSEPVSEFVVKQETDRVWANVVVPEKPFHIQRKFDGIDELDMFNLGIANHDNFLLSGEAGVGKTQSVVNLASHLGLPFVRLEMDGSLSKADTEGRLLPTLDGGWRWHYSRLATVIKFGGVILLNEFSRSLPSNSTLFLGILEEKQLQIETLNEVIPVHPNTIFIADQNIGSRYVGTRQQDPALLDRFNVKLEYNDDPAIESALVPSPALLEIAEALRFLNKQEPAKHKTRVGLRMLLNFVKQAKTYNFQFAVNRFLANFAPEEREAVSLQFESRYLNISQELSVPVGNYSN